MAELEVGLHNMPVIHPVNQQEQWLAEGCYQYYRNDQLMPVVEPWTIHRLPDGRLVTRSERDSSTFGNRLRVHSISSASGIDEFEVEWLRLSDNATEKLSALYRIEQGSIEVTRSGVLGETEVLSAPLPAGCVISPLMRIYTGSVIRQLLKAGRSQVLVPWIRDPNNLDRLLEPLFSEREARFQEEGAVAVGEELFSAQRFEYYGGEYEPGTLFWLDDKDVLLRYRWQQDEDTVWDTRLSYYRPAAEQLAGPGPS